MQKTLTIATGNPKKFSMIAHAFEWMPEWQIERADIDLPELQADTLEEIARTKLEAARSAIPWMCLVDDTAFYLSALSGFPGVYAKHFIKRLGPIRIAEILERLGDPRIEMESLLALWDGEDVRIFTSTRSGAVASTERARGSKNQHDYDALFIPDGADATFEQMSMTEKWTYIPRVQSAQKVAAYLRKRFS